MQKSWDVDQYSQFLALRTRPAKDLLGAIPDSFNPKLIYDLGCGPGNSTILLKERWPLAQVIGLDSSLEMLQQAKRYYPNIEFLEGDIENFEPDKKIDCFFANASLHWLPNHESLFPKLLQHLKPGGLFAIQMPNNFHAPSHQAIINVLKSNSKWQPLIAKLNYHELNEPRFKLTYYYDLLTASGANMMQLWETEYLQVFSNYSAILDWVCGTTLHAIFSYFSEEEKLCFTERYLQAISSSYPKQANNCVLFPFRRIFMIGIVTA